MTSAETLCLSEGGSDTAIAMAGARARPMSGQLRGAMAIRPFYPGTSLLAFSAPTRSAGVLARSADFGRSMPPTLG